MVTREAEDLVLGSSLDVEPKPEEVEAPPAEEAGQAEAAEKPTETLEFWRSQAQGLESRARKAENDLRSVQIGTMRQQERDQLLRETREEIEVLRRTQTALAKAFGSGATEGVAEELDRIETEARTTRGQRSFTERAVRLFAQLTDAVTGEDGKPVLDLATSSELAEARDMWNRGVQEKDLGTLTDALAEVHRVSLAKQREQLKAGLEVERKAGVEKARRTVEATGANDLTVGRPVGSPQVLRNADDVANAIIQASTGAEARQILEKLSPEIRRQVQERLGIQG